MEIDRRCKKGRKTRGSPGPYNWRLVGSLKGTNHVGNGVGVGGWSGGVEGGPSRWIGRLEENRRLERSRSGDARSVRPEETHDEFGQGRDLQRSEGEVDQLGFEGRVRRLRSSCGVHGS